jgi:hypothetical protein
MLKGMGVERPVLPVAITATPTDLAKLVDPNAKGDPTRTA